MAIAKKKRRPPVGRMVCLNKIERSTLRTALKQYADGIYGTTDESENKLFARLHTKLRG